MTDTSFQIGPVRCDTLDDLIEHLEDVAALALDAAKIDRDPDERELAIIKGRIGMLRVKRDPALRVA
jgi:hypothetical protein